MPPQAPPQPPFPPSLALLSVVFWPCRQEPSWCVWLRHYRGQALWSMRCVQVGSRPICVASVAAPLLQGQRAWAEQPRCRRVVRVGVFRDRQALPW